MTLFIIADAPTNIRADEQVFSVVLLKLQAAIHTCSSCPHHDGRVMRLHDLPLDLAFANPPPKSHRHAFIFLQQTYWLSCAIHARSAFPTRSLLLEIALPEVSIPLRKLRDGFHTTPSHDQ